MPSLQERAWEALENKNDHGRAINAFVLALILASIVAVILESVPWIQRDYARPLHIFEVLSVTVFSLEYLARVWACAAAPEYAHPLWGRLRFMRTPMAIVDVIAVLPFFLPFIVGTVDARMLRAVRLLRFFRLLKAGRYAETIAVIGRVVASRKEELLIVVSVLLIALIVASSLMYYLEHEAQPDVFGSIPESMWWGIITLTTIGYGDAYPITPLGKLLGASIALVGIGLFGLPAGILASGFMDEIQKRTREKEAREAALATAGAVGAAAAPGEGRGASPRVCPHCGKGLDAGGGG